MTYHQYGENADGYSHDADYLISSKNKYIKLITITYARILPLFNHSNIVIQKLQKSKDIPLSKL